MPLLDIQPRTLKFAVDLKKPSSCTVQLNNTTPHYVAFKVKTTSPKKYCVRPNVGVVAPNSSCEFTVIMQAFKELPQDMVCKDKFLIQSTAVPAETTDEDITASMFSKAEGKLIEENKLRVTLIPSSDSPQLSPVKRTLTQEAVTEDSTLKDRLYSQSETVTPPQYDNELTKESGIIGHNELMAADDAKELKPSKRDIVDRTEDLYTANDFKPTKGGHDTSRMEKETEFDPIRSPKEADVPIKKAMDLPRDQGFTNGITSANSVTGPYEPTIRKDRDVVQLQKTDIKALPMDEYKLVKDIEEMKLKVNGLESKLKQADTTIEKLLEERSISCDHRESLKQELVEMRTRKIVKEVHIGFPLLFVCVVAFISFVIGYWLHT